MAAGGCGRAGQSDGVPKADRDMMCAELERANFRLRKAYGANIDPHQRSCAHERKIKCALHRDREGEGGEGDRENQSDDGLGKGELCKFCGV